MPNGNLWCRHIPTARIDRGLPKHVTLIVPYYENPGFLAEQLATWAKYPAKLRSWLSVIVVDDGSPFAPASAVVAVQCPDPPAWLRVFRIEVDVRWNWLAARNIGAFHAPEGWILLTDMDHVVPRDTLEGVIHGAHNPAVLYAFSRKEHTGAPLAPHSASFLMTRALFWQIGGYDETLSGFYGTDGDYRRRASQHALMAILPDPLIRHEYQGDSSTRRYLRKQPEDAMVRQIVSRRPPVWTPKTLSFPYHEEPLCP